MTEYLKVQEVAEILNVSGGLVRKLLRERKIEGVKLGADWRISRGALDTFIRENTQTVLPAADPLKVNRPLPTRIV